MDLYRILQVADDARREDIRAAYLVLVQESHPDRRHVDPDLHELADESRFKRIQEAFEILHDPARRAEYDRTRTVVRRGGVVVPPAGTGRRRDIPMHWLYRSGASGRSKRRLGRWIFLALMLAMVVAFLSLRQHFFWRRSSSRAMDAPPTSRLAPRDSQVAISPTEAPEEVRHPAVDIDPEDLPPAVDPHPRPDEQDRAQTPFGESAAELPPVEESFSTSYWHPSFVDSASVPPAMYPHFVGELVRFEPATYDPPVIVPASWQVEDRVSVWTGYPPFTPGVPLPRATVAPLPINIESLYLLDAPIADARGAAGVRWQAAAPFLEPLLISPWTDEMPISRVPNPPSFVATVPPNLFAAVHLDPGDLGRSVNVPVPSERFPPPNASRLRPPVLQAKPHRQESRATHKWETPWGASQSRDGLAPRGHTPWTWRRQAASRHWPDSVNRHATGTVWPPTLNEIQRVRWPRNVSRMGVTWSTSPPIVDSPVTGFRSDPLSLGSTSKANQFESAPPSPVSHAGDSFYQLYQRRETSLRDP